jgi:luciferase family oxidoreductase group 1
LATVVVPLSVLDLVPIGSDTTATAALAHSTALIRRVEQLGYQRYWVAEHHGMPGIASSSPAVLIAHLAGASSRIRVGSGGVMLPNHQPLVIAEQFGTLASLFPGRIDLGLGRAPGSDQITARALRRTLGAADSFPQDVVELMSYFRRVEPGQVVQAVPGAGLDVPIWILGSSLFGAQLAAALGLPFAFASHFAPALMTQAVELYRAGFRASEQLEHPYVMLGVNLFAADSEGEARVLFTSLQQAFVNLRLGRPGRLPPPVAGYEQRLGLAERAILDQTLSASIVGTPEMVRQELDEFVPRTGADELMVTSQIFDHAARLRSFEITARACDMAARAPITV